jgi:D-methionine transport system ATP-binding protein
MPVNAPLSALAPFQRLVPAAPIVRLEGVSKVFAARNRASVAALDGIDLTVRQGSVLGVIGRSGAGKSTLIRLVNGLERPSAGRVIVDGAEISALPERSLRQARRSIGMIFQHFNLLSSRTAAENVALPLEVAGYDAGAIRTRVDELLALVGLTDKRNRYPRNCPAARSSAWASPGRWPPSPRCSCRTRRPRRWTRRPPARSSISSPASTRSSGSPSCSSPTRCR